MSQMSKSGGKFIFAIDSYNYRHCRKTLAFRLLWHDTRLSPWLPFLNKTKRNAYRTDDQMLISLEGKLFS